MRITISFLSGLLFVLPWALAEQEELPAVAAISSAMEDLRRHMDGTETLPAEGLKARGVVLAEHVAMVRESPKLLRQALELAAEYERAEGALFLNDATKGGFPRKAAGGLELERAIFILQQGIVDHAYTPENLKRYESVLDGVAFETANFFPGAVDAPVDSNAVREVTINASQPECWGIPIMDNETPARRPTGCYLAPGSVAEVVVPPALVGKGFSVRVGAHSWDLANKPKIVRLDRVSLVYPIKEPVTKIANPLGGGIYIEVPYKASADLVQVKIRNAVRSPFFSARSFDKTALEEWRNVERKHPGPWADFESDKFMMQVPTKWIYAFDDPVTLMKDWDTSMDMVSELFGLPLVRPKTMLYLQVDLTYRGSANFPGYPQSNFHYNPLEPEDGHSDHWLLKGPQSAGEIIFHELGHAHLFTKFRGETEAVVNLPYVAVLNRGFGVDLDTAFGRSFSKPNVSLDQAAITWMVTENFRNGKAMDISNSPANEVRYQHRGYGKYVEIINLFGWEALQKFWHSVNLDHIKGIEYSRNSDPTDSRILRMSTHAGADLTPLIHFWGIQPEDGAALKQAMVDNGLQPSARIYDRLAYYKTVVPMSNEEFEAHAKTVNPKAIRSGKNPLYGEGWYYDWLSKYEKAHGEAAQATLQNIIDTYFPDGRPRS